MTDLRENIIEELKQTNGNVSAVATRLGVSDTYVRTVLKDMPPEEILAASSNGRSGKDQKAISLFQEFRDAVIQPNKTAIITLRDSTLEKLQESLDEEKLPDKLKLNLLRILLDYETAGRSLARPLANVNVDQSTRILSIQGVADQLSQLPTEQIKALRESARNTIDVTPSGEVGVD